MLTSVVISAITCLVMILGVLFFPKIKVGKNGVASYWVIALIGALLLVVSGQTDFQRIGSALMTDNAINPLKILVLFISMTILSIYLDELGFFRYLANKTLRHAGTSQLKLFLYLIFDSLGADGVYLQRCHHLIVHAFHLLFHQERENQRDTLSGG